ncbi:hypothetical protein GV827_14000 [Sulfitobacter sp. JBTF-M27]|uniref:Phage tail protein n=1 Tax=Sulfitobacter sediminilitoris TaxID=2698830 RepID=A0A6P0CEJ5_9RHOB|nr:hypothetical protein [Sulfitobacter sediminilitoris]NEK23515.1 hypothetical protein [Sulfitobacter sediminilitoris]
MTEQTPVGAWLYDSLPEVYRSRDASEGYPLRDFLMVLGETGDTLLDEAARLYDNQFIETCDEWLVPYIGALIGYRPVHDVGRVSQRALVGRWIELVRSKGTAATVEEVARGATGWPAKVVEYFQNLAHPQFINHLRPQVHGGIDMRNAARLEDLGSAFDSAHYTVDVGRIALREGQHNIHNVGLFLWRLRTDQWPRHQAFQVGPRRFALHTLGLDTQVFNTPVTESGADALAGPVNLPIPLRRRFLDANLSDYYPRAFRIWVNGLEVLPGGLRICNLSDFGAGWAHAPDTTVAFDPVLGRIATPASSDPPESVEIEAYTAFPSDIGSGAYERATGFATALVPVTTVATGDNLQTALDGVQTGGAVEITDSETYPGSFSIDVDADQRLEFRAANGQRPTLDLTADMEITGAAESEVSLDGLLIGGGAIVVPDTGTNALRRLTLRHLTLLPGISAEPDGTPLQPTAPSLVIEAPNVIVEIDSCVLGGIRCHPSTVIEIRDSAVDATETVNVALAALDGESPGGRVTLGESTVIGKINARVFTLISNAILMAELATGDSWTIPIQAQDTQTGCARFSYIPPGSKVPRRYRCQPSLALAEAMAAAKEITPVLSPAQETAITRRVEGRMRPGFNERRYGRSAYLQLRNSTPVRIKAGADDESEMGVWHQVYQPQRESNLLTRLDEFLPSGLEAGFFYET